MLRVSRTSIAPLACAIAIAACASDDRDEIAACRQDASGLRALSAATWDSIPQLQVASTATTNFNVTDILAAEDWRTELVAPIEAANGDIIAAGGEWVIRYNNEGRIQHRFRGAGPTELRFPTGIAATAPDTFAVFDMLASRVSWHDSTLRPVRSRVVPYLVTKMHATVPVSATANGDLILRSSWSQRETTKQERVRPENVIVVLKDADSEPSVIARMVGSELAPLGGSTGIAAPVLLGERTHVVAWDSLIAVGTGQYGYTIELFDHSGARAGGFCVPVKRRPVSREDRAVLRARAAAALPLAASAIPESIASREWEFDQRTVASYLPAYERLMVDSEDRLWVIDAIAPSDSTWSATAYALPGTPVARLTGRGRNAPVAILGDRVFVREDPPNGFIFWRAYPFR